MNSSVMEKGVSFLSNTGILLRSGPLAAATRTMRIYDAISGLISKTNDRRRKTEDGRQ